ncbi:hypothetical protein B5P45_25190 [Phyllobacterium zundukense]|uniref:Uncharacterized protein n=2 Tax=Phyllobacterium zundukense TaxID=1867719 RepID=A0A2N9VS54_9HYPH|nr:hypothetical protein BLM14_14730 [Phyllobacterium zundukense]PIO42322.1 hypothetical protein B5P45_25190 [Phyllobacterium zundukense]
MTVLWVFASIAYAEAAEENCLSKHTKFDLCEASRGFQAEVAPSLPMKLNANTTLERVAAIGPSVVMYAAWAQTYAEFQAKLEAAGVAKEVYIENLNTMTKTMICGQEPTAAFVRLGGVMQYHYRTADAVPVTMATVSECP